MIESKGYHLIFWANNMTCPVDMILKGIHVLIDLKHNILTPSRYFEKIIKNDDESIRKLIQRRNRENIGFKSLLLFNSSGDVSMRYSISEPGTCLISTIIIEFIKNPFVGTNPELSVNDIVGLVKSYVEIYKPFRGWLENQSNNDIIFEEEAIESYHETPPGSGNWAKSITYTSALDTIDRQKVPETIHWVNYFDNSIVDRIGRSLLLSADVFLVEELTDGVLLVLQSEPFDVANPIHLRRQQVINQYLHLPELQKKYRR